MKNDWKRKLALFILLSAGGFGGSLIIMAGLQSNMIWYDKCLTAFLLGLGFVDYLKGVTSNYHSGKKLLG